MKRLILPGDAPWWTTPACLLLLAWLFAGTGCGSKQETEPAKTDGGSSGNPVTAPVDYLGAVGKAQQSATKTTATVGIQQAIQHFQIQEGRYPKDLNELVSPKYLSALPEPPRGMKFDYNAATGQVKLVPAN